MAELNVALILRLVDRLTGPARAAASQLEALGRTGAAATRATTAANRAGAAASEAVAQATRGAGAALEGAASAGRSYGVSMRTSAVASAGAAASARLSTAAIAGSAEATKAASVATDAGSGSAKIYSAALQVTATAATGLGQAVRVSVDALGRSTEASREASESARDLAQGEASAGRAAETAGRRFSVLERIQMRGRAAMRMLRTETEQFDRSLGRLAMASLAVEGMAPLAHGLSHLVGHSVGEAASFQAGMTGFGITAELSDAQMAPIRAAILKASVNLGLRPEEALETFAFTRRSGVFTRPAEIIAAGNEAARFQKLAERMGSPVTGEEVAGGASSAVREYGMAATPGGLRRYFAMLDAAEKSGGGMTMDALLQYSRSAGGQMKAFGAGNIGGLADVLAAQQVAMFLSHTPGQAGINVQDLLANISHRMTVRRFAKMGISLPKYMKAAWTRGESPLQAFADLAMKLTARMKGTDVKFKLGELLANQQAGQSLLALSQNMPAFLAKRNSILRPRAVDVYDADVRRVAADPKSRFQSFQAAVESLRISMGDILLPIASRLATVFARVAEWMSRVSTRGGLLARLGAFSIAGLAGVMTAAVGLGHLFVGIAAPYLTARFLLRRGLPLGARVVGGRMAAMAARGGRLAGAAADLALAPGRLAYGGLARAGRAGLGAVRAAPGLVMAAPGAAIRGLRAAQAAALGFGRSAATAIAGVSARVRGFSVGAVITGFRQAGVAAIGFARSGRLAALAMNLFKFAARGALAASGIGLLILAGVLIVQHWQGVVTFFQGFGRGFTRAIAPIRPALQPLISGVQAAASWVGKLFGGNGKPGEDWSKWGEAAGAAVGDVVLALAKVIGWIGKAIGAATQFWSAITGRGAKIAAGAAAAAVLQAGAPALAAPTPAAPRAGAPQTPQQAAAKIAPPQPAPGGRATPSSVAARPATVIRKTVVHQTFKVDGGQHDTRKLARELHRLGEKGQRAALHDGADDE